MCICPLVGTGESTPQPELCSHEDALLFSNTQLGWSSSWVQELKRVLLSLHSPSHLASVLWFHHHPLCVNITIPLSSVPAVTFGWKCPAA